MKLCSLNARGLREVNKCKEIIKFLRTQKFDIICLQETHSIPSDEWQWSKQFGGYKCFFSHGDNFSKGVCTLIADKFKSNLIYADPDGRALIIECTVESRTILLTNLYGPNTDSPAFFTNIFKQTLQLSGLEGVFVGDYNVVIYPELDRTEKVQYAPQAAKTLQDLMEEHDLADIWRVRNPEKRVYSYMRRKHNSPGFTGSRIDYALVSMGLLQVVDDIQYTHGFKTDHSLLSMCLSFEHNKRGKGYWKFNNNLLHNKEFVDECNKIFSEVPQTNGKANPDIVWELCKQKVISLAKDRGKTAAQK